MIRTLATCAALVVAGVIVAGSANAAEPVTSARVVDQAQDQAQVSAPTEVSSARRHRRHSRHHSRYHRDYVAPSYQRSAYYYEGYPPGWGPAPFPFIFGLPRFH